MSDFRLRAPRATIHDVARVAGVSIGTVSRVLNGHGRTGPQTRERVHNAVQILGYRVNTVAQSMRRQTTNTIALLVHDITNQIFATAAAAAQEVLERAGYMLVLASSGPDPNSEASAVRVMSQRRMDGIIGFLRREDDPETIEALQDFDGAIVLFDREMDVTADVVLTDHASGVTRATRHLLDNGHRSIALIGSATHIYPGRERVRGFVEAYRQCALQAPADLIRKYALDADYGFRETYSLLSNSPRPTAIIAATNQILEGVIAAIRQAGLRVPQDISLVSFDDSPLARMVEPPVTVISRSVTQMGTMAAEMILERLRAGRSQPPQKVVLPTEIVLRGSCGPGPKDS
jgi:LacI family transcriptional regulator